MSARLPSQSVRVGHVADALAEGQPSAEERRSRCAAPAWHPVQARERRSAYSAASTAPRPRARTSLWWTDRQPPRCRAIVVPMPSAPGFGRDAADGDECGPAKDGAAAVPEGGTQVDCVRLRALVRTGSARRSARARERRARRSPRCSSPIGVWTRATAGSSKCASVRPMKSRFATWSAASTTTKSVSRVGEHGVQLSRHPALASHARPVVDAELVAHSGEPGPVTVIEHDDLGGQAHAGRGGERRHEHLVRLVGGRDEHRDRRGRLGDRRAVRAPCRRSTW